MEAVEVLHVSPEAFFNEITRSILNDIQKETNKKLHASQLKSGLSYKKKLPGRFSANAEVVIKILTCIPNKTYASSYCSDIDETITTYEIEAMEENKIRVTYSETFTMLHHRESKSQKFFATKNMRGNKKGKKLLKQIEEFILQQKEAQ